MVNSFQLFHKRRMFFWNSYFVSNVYKSNIQISINGCKKQSSCLGLPEIRMTSKIYKDSLLIKSPKLFRFRKLLITNLARRKGGG